jgi:hypothetical protein
MNKKIYELKIHIIFYWNFESMEYKKKNVIQLGSQNIWIISNIKLLTGVTLALVYWETMDE